MNQATLQRDASGRLSFSIEMPSMLEFSPMVEELANSLRLSPQGELLTDAATIMARSYGRGGQTVELAWDIWMGFTVTAENLEAEPLVREVASFLSGRLSSSRRG